MTTRSATRKRSKVPRRITSAVTLEMEKWCAIWNSECFGSALRPVAITLLPAKNRKEALLGWYCARRWEKGKDTFDEINVCPEKLKRPAEEVLETLLHEMVHQKNVHDGVQGVSPNSNYHNGRFRAEAERVGLVCTYGPGVGWGLTRLGEAAMRIIRRHKLNRKVFTIARLSDPDQEKRPPSRWRKWICGCGPIRVPREEFEAVCSLCTQEFERA